MASSGHGVSEAVRNHIGIWVTDEVAKVIGVRVGRLRIASSWKRKARRKSPSGFGYEREYHCEEAPGVKLIVHSPSDDYSADRYVFMVKGHAVAGGKTRLKSVQTTSAISTSDATEMKISGKAGFTALTDSELQKITMNLVYGKADDFAFLELERG